VRLVGVAAHQLYADRLPTLSGVAATMTVVTRTHARSDRADGEAPGGIRLVEELLEEARQLDLASAEGRFRLGDLAEALGRELPIVADLHDRLAIDLEVDRDTVTEAWLMASAFPPATRRPGQPWVHHVLLRFHPARHELLDRAAAAGWDRARLHRELAARSAAHHTRPDNSASVRRRWRRR
jgi:hypothetical protein